MMAIAFGQVHWVYVCTLTRQYAVKLVHIWSQDATMFAKKGCSKQEYSHFSISIMVSKIVVMPEMQSRDAHAALWASS